MFQNYPIPILTSDDWIVENVPKNTSGKLNMKISLYCSKTKSDMDILQPK